MARILTTGWELGHTDNNAIVEASSVYFSGSGEILDTVITPARYNGRALRQRVSTGSAYAVCNLSSSLSEFWLRFAFRFNHYGDVTQVCSIASWALSGSLLGSVRINLLNGALSLFSSSTSLATGTAMLAPNKWYLIEIHWKSSASSGIADLTVDGVSDIAFSGNTGTSSFNQLCFGSVRNQGASWPYGMYFYYDDCAADDATWVGDGHINVLAPNGDGAHSDFLGSDGNSVLNWQLVSSIPYSPTSYVIGTTGQKDEYAITDTAGIVPANATVRTLDVLVIAKNMLGNTPFSGMVRTGGSDYTASAKNAGIDWTLQRFPFVTNPGTSSAWLLSEVDAVEAGVAV